MPHPRPAESRVHGRRDAAAAIESTDGRAVLRWRLMFAPRHRIGALLAALCLALLGATSAFARAPGPVTSKGAFKLVTYNIAGLPEGISRSRPRTNIPLIAPLLADYDIALVQEDFAYQSLLRAGVPHRHQSRPYVRRIGFDVGDGLSRFAHTSFTDPVRYAWSQCHGYFDSGSDCLARKGFSFARHQLTNDVEVDIYNVHFDAGWSANDSATRRSQVEQLVQVIGERSKARPVIVAGDTNMFGQDSSLLEQLKSGAELRDSCRTLSCAQPGRIDRVLYRSSDTLQLRPKSWGIDGRFVDARRQPLSDHLAVAVAFEWALRESQLLASP